MSHAIKVLGKFNVLDILIPQKTEQMKTAFCDHIVYQYHTNFYVYHRPNNQPNECERKKNYLLFWTVPKKIKVLLAFSCFPTYSD